MKVLIGISHPKQVHMFKNLIKQLAKKGSEINIILIKREMSKYLINQLQTPYSTIGKFQPNFIKKIMQLPNWEYLTLKIVTKFQPDILLGQAIPQFAHISALINKPYIIFEDTEPATLLQKISLPFTDAIVTPNCFLKDFGKKHIRFNGIFELAYLHPKYFKPDSSVLTDVNIDKKDKLIVVRFVSWQAIHDMGEKGIDMDAKISVIKELEKFGKVIISSETPLPKKFEKYRVRVKPDKIHDLLYYSTLYFGESGTMASEAAVLGTPSILFNPIVSKKQFGNFLELEEEYGLMHSYETLEKALNKCKMLLSDEKIKHKWQVKRKKYLDSKIDVASFMLDFVENYPESFKKYKKSRRSH